MLYIHPRREPVKKPTPATPQPHPAHWLEAAVHESDETTEGSNWLLSYADVVTLLFALFVVLCAHQKIMLDQSAKAEPTEQKVAVVAVAQPSAVSAPAPQPIAQVSATGTPPVEVPSQRTQPEKSDVIPTSIATTTLPDSATMPAQWLSMPDTARFVSPPVPMNTRLTQADLNHWVEFSASNEKVRLEVNDKILFDPASAKLKPEGILVLDSLAQWLKLQAGQIDVEGHTDNSPISTLKFGSNWELSSARASAVTRYLISRGLTPERIKAIGLADTQPRTGNDNPEGRARNRRVSLVLYLLKQEGMPI